MSKETIFSDLDLSTQKLLDSLSQFTQSAFHARPSGHEWSASGVVEHLLKLDVIANKVLRAETIPADRAPDEKVAMLKQRMADATKRKASEAVSPSGEAGDKDLLMAQLREQRAALKTAVETLDETEVCVSYPHPAAGTMTRLEWIYFTIYHTERHVRQLNELAQTLTSTTAMRS